MKDSKKIQVCEPLITKNAKKYLKDCIDSEWISSSGKYLEAFEKKWASYCGAKDGIAVTNGTSALQVAFKSLNLKPGDEVIMPSFTIISCATAIIEAETKSSVSQTRDPAKFEIGKNKAEMEATFHPELSKKYVNIYKPRAVKTKRNSLSMNTTTATLSLLDRRQAQLRLMFTKSPFLSGLLLTRHGMVMLACNPFYFRNVSWLPFIPYKPSKRWPSNP